MLQDELRVLQNSSGLLVKDDSAALGLLMKIRTQELEMKAYLRGLKFLART